MVKKGRRRAKEPTKDEMREGALRQCGDRLPIVIHGDGEVELFKDGKWIKQTLT